MCVQRVQSLFFLFLLSTVIKYGYFLLACLSSFCNYEARRGKELGRWEPPVLGTRVTAYSIHAPTQASALGDQRNA